MNKKIIIGAVLMLVLISSMFTTNSTNNVDDENEPPSIVDMLDNVDSQVRPYWDFYQNSVPYKMDPPIIPFRNIYNNWRLGNILWGFK